MRLSIFIPLLICAQSARSSVVNLQEAIDRCMVDYQIKYLGYADQSGNAEKRNNIQLTLNNLTNNAVSVEIPSGTYLDELSNKEQDHVIIDQIVVTIQPKLSKNALLNGYCVQFSKSAPNQLSQFKIVPTKKEFITLASWLHTSKTYNHTAQSAFWCLSDSLSISSIYHDDKKKTFALWALLADITHRPVPRADEYKELFVVHEQFDGMLNFNIDHTAAVSIQIKDKAGNILSTMLEKKPIEKGAYKIKYHISKAMSESDELFVELEIDNQIVMNKRHLMRII